MDFKFRRQWPIGGYIVDFVCFERHLIIELDGSQHAEESAMVYDAERTQFLETGGFTVIRFWNSEIKANLDGVLQTVHLHLK
jgi:very-short-patch-repair endonuclease